MTLDWTAIRKRRLFLASPLYGGMLHFNFYQSVLNLMTLAAREKVFVGIKHVINDSLVPRARNRLAAYFLESDATDILFCDSDMGFKPEDALSLVALDEPIVGGIYSRKQVDWVRVQRAARAGFRPDRLPLFGVVPVLNWLGPVMNMPLDSLYPVRHLGTGFLRLRREVFESMIRKFGDEIAFDYPGDEDQFRGRIGYDFFPCGIDRRFPLGSGDRQYLSEDWFHCERARQCGFEPMAAPWVRLTHTGSYDYTCDLSVMESEPEPEKEKEAALVD